jgi:hypothetical protein
MNTNRITDKNGINYLIKKPQEGQMCQTKVFGTEAYHSKSKYTNGYFETYEDKGNRMQITRWKIDLWLPL